GVDAVEPGLRLHLLPQLPAVLLPVRQAQHVLQPLGGRLHLDLRVEHAAAVQAHPHDSLPRRSPPPPPSPRLPPPPPPPASPPRARRSSPGRPCPPPEAGPPSRRPG